MTESALSLSKALFPARPLQSFTTTTVPLSALTEDAIVTFLNSCRRDPVTDLGISFTQGEHCKLSSVVFASSTSSHVLHITHLSKGKTFANKRRLLHAHIFQNSSLRLRLIGAHMDVLAYGLFTDAAMLLSNGVDLQSLIPLQSGARDDVNIFMRLLQGSWDPARSKVLEIFCHHAHDSLAKAVVRAREYALIATRHDMLRSIDAAPLVSTHGLEVRLLAVAAKIHREGLRLAAARPTVQKNDVGRDTVSNYDGTVVFTSERYKTRIRQTGRQKLVLRDVNGEEVEGRVREVQGRMATVSLSGSLPFNIASISTVGKDPSTAAERRKDAILLELLQGRTSLADNAPFSAIWFPSSTVTSTATSPGPSALHTTIQTTATLNASQRGAVQAILRQAPPDEVDVQLVIGPPGTGKTTVIAASVQALTEADRPVWLVAQSNVAVKNIAEKLADLNFWDFKILVSYEFHFDWHEHIYEKIQQKVILSDEFPPTIVDVERALEGANVILCTLPMLSNYRVQASGFTTLVPVETLIVDEASQISLADYLVPVSAFKHTLRKLVFVGDNQQLAPYGSEQMTEIQSIFEVETHYKRALMLDISYRLPPPLCRFISTHMYGGKLTAWNKHPVTTRNAACRFIHVPGGAETNVGTSWKNELEATACIAVARRLLSIGRTDFKVITPYDPQRDVIERKLKAAGLPWKDTVFCVDSFQGNEAAHVIISVVRTSSPGFLKSVRRMNVMLTRCTRGMYICGSRTFLNGGIAQETLLGKMSREWGEGAWESVQDVLNRSKLEEGVA